MGGIRRRWEEVRGRECRRKEEVPVLISFSNVTTPPSLPPITKPYRRRRVGGRDRRR